MLELVLSFSGGRVVVPEATAVVAGDFDDSVSLVDASGRVLVVFRRQDVAPYLKDDSTSMIFQDSEGGRDGGVPGPS